MGVQLAMHPVPHAPHSIATEQALLGAILNSSAAFDAVEPLVSGADFFEPCHGDIFEICNALRRDGSGITYQLVVGRLGADGDIDIAGLPYRQYLARLAREADSITSAPDYAKEIREHANQRKLVAVAHLLEDGAGRGNAKARDLATLAIAELDELAAEGISKSSVYITLGDAASEALDALTERLQNPGKLPGLSCGISRQLDKTNRRLSGRGPDYFGGTPRHG